MSDTLWTAVGKAGTARNGLYEIVVEIEGLVVMGLDTDGGHHKQWCLEEIGKLVGFNIEDMDYEPGIAP